MLVKVVNDNVHPYHEKFKGREIHIPAKGFVEMDMNDAHVFLGTMPGNIEVDGNGIQKPTSYKKLRIDTDMTPAVSAQAKSTVCMACNTDLHTDKALEAHIAETHVDEMVDEDAKVVAVKKRGRPAKS